MRGKRDLHPRSRSKDNFRINRTDTLGGTSGISRVSVTKYPKVTRPPVNSEGLNLKGRRSNTDRIACQLPLTFSLDSDRRLRQIRRESALDLPVDQAMRQEAVQGATDVVRDLPSQLGLRLLRIPRDVRG